MSSSCKGRFAVFTVLLQQVFVAAWPTTLVDTSGAGSLCELPDDVACCYAYLICTFHMPLGARIVRGKHSTRRAMLEAIAMGES